MNAIDTRTLLIVAVVVLVLIALALAAFFFYQKKQSQRLQQRFGPEYQRAINELGNRTKAESELKAREKRVESFHVVPLAPAEAARFSQNWKALQSRFVDDPKGSVIEADKLVRELMEKRGYPVGDFERRAADISVDHPNVVENYRAAQAIALRAGRDATDTEALRKAVVHYRVLFAELLEVKEVKQEVRTDKKVEVRT
jgi:hypothetical protein